MTDIVTENWSDFGYREKKMAIELLQAWLDEKYARPSLEMGENVRAAFNRESGWVFLTNDNYDAFVFNANGELDLWLSCPNCGSEGFPETLFHHPECEDCHVYARDILDNEGR